MKDYTQRPNVVKFLPWWLNAIKGMNMNMNKEEAIRRLKKNENIKFINYKDRLGLIQELEKL